MSRAAAALLAGALLLGSPAGADPQDSKEPEKKVAASFSAEIDVSIVTVVVRAVDTWGRPLLGLKPEDFRGRVGKREIPVDSLYWVGEGAVEVPPQAASPSPAPAGPEEK